MERSRILVSGFPDGTTGSELTVYFQSKRNSGGGDVESIEFDGRGAIVTFEDVEAAERVSGRQNHRLQNRPLRVVLLPDESSDPRSKEGTTLKSGSGPNQPRQWNNHNIPSSRRFENQTFDHDIKPPRILNWTAPGTVPGAPPRPEQCTVEVFGLPPDVSEDLVMNYFENTKRSKGGPVSTVVINPESQKCLVTFESAEDAIRTVEHSPHTLSGASMHVWMHEEFEDENPDDFDEHTVGEGGFTDENDIIIIVSGILPSTSEDAIVNYFENSRRSGGGEVSNCHYTDDGEATITFLEVKDLERLLEKPHTINGKALTVVRQLPKKKLPPDPVGDDDCTDENDITIIVSGLLPSTSKDAVVNYFENSRRSGGGEVSNFHYTDDGEAIITLLEVKDLERLLKKPHTINGKALTVVRQLPKKKLPPDPVGDDDCTDENDIIIIVSGLLPSTSKDAVVNYFENSRRSGGGEVSNFHYTDDGEAIITFLEVKDLGRLLEKPHTINGKALTVWRQLPKKKLPPDPVKIHVQGISETTSEDCLRFYLEKFSDAEVVEVYLGCNNNALATFESEPDFESLFRKVSRDKKGLEGKKPHLERVPICSCILVTELKKETTDDTIQLYFENEKRSGGKDVSQVERKGKDQALVYFEDPSSVQNVMVKSQTQGHTLEGQTLDVKPHYPFLEDTRTKKTEIPCDPKVFEYIQMSHEHELQTLLNEQEVLVELSRDSQNSIITISPLGKGKRDSEQSWKEKTEILERFFHSFEKIEIPVDSEIFDEIAQRWQKNSSSQGQADFVVSFDDHRRIALLVGKKACVDQEKQKLQGLIHKVKEDTELMKSVVQVTETNIPKSRLILLEMSGLCQTLTSQHRHLSISVDSDGQKLCLKGPRSVLQEVKVDVFTFISKVFEQTTELPTNVINVLKRPDVSGFIQDLLKKKSIQAVVLFNQGQSSNEIQVVGVDSRNTKEAEKELQGVVQEKSHHFTAENAQVLGSHKWKDLWSSLTSHFKVGIMIDNHTNTIWVSGIAKDVEESFEKVRRFLEINTILYATIPTEKGSAQFISTVWKQKLNDIKRELSSCSIDMRVTADCKGIEVSGTAEGLEKCLPRLREVINAVEKDSVPVDKPGMKKFFLGDKGPIFLRLVEDKNKCVILTTECDEEEAVANLETEEKDSWSTADFVCSYPTKQGKTISVMKGDITKDRVDAIVNAANGDLKHIGGVAAAIVKAGGKKIQEECDDFVMRNGPLLEGHTHVTTAGMLPSKIVIHAYGPRWDTEADRARRNEEVTKQERYLRCAIANSLEEAKDLRSIAIPAVSSGVFGFPRDLCAEVILNTVLEFCKENPHCMLSEIRLINNDDATVKVFADELRRRFGTERNFTDQKSGRPTTTVAGADSRTKGKTLVGTPRSFTTQGIRITVKSSDLAKEQADILVGTAASNLNLTQNPCAKALSQAAGPSLQQECTNIGQVAVGDIAVNTHPGNLKCKAVIFAICSHWDNGKGKKVLKRLLTKCLQEATKMRMVSIAFPAIGTGTLNFPRAEVAETYFDEIISFNQKNPTTSLKEVRFVLYDQDHQTVQAFEAELKKRNEKNVPIPVRKSAKRHQWATAEHSKASSSHPATFSPVRERNQNHFETNVGTLCFKVQPGDVTKETTDAIVIISNPELDMKRGGAGAAVLKSGGDSIQKECSRLGHQRPGSVVVTSAGNLRARFIFHIVPPDPLDTRSIKVSVMKCLEEAEKRRITSISFPAIGTGNLGISAKSCANAMLSVIRDFSYKQPTSLQLIKMIVFQIEMINEVRLAIKEASGETITEKPGMIQRFVSTVGGFLGFRDSDKDAPTEKSPVNEYNKDIELVIFAGSRRDVQGAVNEINEAMKEKSTKQIIENEAIRYFSKGHFRKINTLEQRYDVSVSVEKIVERIVVRGQSDDILYVAGEIHKMLHQLREEEHERKRAEALSKDIQWMYSDGINFIPYESQANAKIELAYHDEKDTVTLTSEEGDDYKVDFTTMQAKDAYGTIISKVKRVDKKNVQVPNHWTPQPKDSQGNETTVHLHQLDSSKDVQEYQNVQNRFQKTCSNQIMKIERVQNPVLYRTYAIRKQKMDEGKGSNEQWLFHGTPGSNCQLINHTGFNRSFHGKNATVYGNGVYFALDASYSARSTYSPPDASGCRYMYFTRVLVGEYTLGRQGLLTPPAKNASDPTDTYDSVVDQIPNPGIFVVFYDWQCYPEYLITFQ